MAKRIKAARGAFERAQVRGPSLNVLLSNPRSAVRAYAAAAARLARLLEQHTEAAAAEEEAKPAAEKCAESAGRGADDEALEEALAAHLEGTRAKPRRAAKRPSCPPASAPPVHLRPGCRRATVLNRVTGCGCVRSQVVPRGRRSMSWRGWRRQRLRAREPEAFPEARRGAWRGRPKQWEKTGRWCQLVLCHAGASDSPRTELVGFAVSVLSLQSRCRIYTLGRRRFAALVAHPRAPRHAYASALMTGARMICVHVLGFGSHGETEIPT